MATEQQLDDNCKRIAREQMCKLRPTENMPIEEKKKELIKKLKLALMTSRGVSGIKGIST